MSTTFKTIVHNYDSGRLTAHDAVCKYLSKLTDDHTSESLEHLGTELTTELVKYIVEFVLGQKSTCNWTPSIKQIGLARTWLEESGLMPSQ